MSRYKSGEEMALRKKGNTARNEKVNTISQDDLQRADVKNRYGSCLAPVTDDDSALVCEICEYWHHIRCENV